MPLALILSSHVASSRVGGSAQALALSLFGIEAAVAPTVLYGRHPGWGAPGGAAVADETFAGVLEGIGANGAFERAGLLLCGYFASPGQVRLAAETAKDCPEAVIVVDPIMGDAAKGLYVRAEVADAIGAELIPLAGLVAPNAWELERLTGVAVSDAASAVEAARRLGRPTLVSSIDCGAEIGVVYADSEQAWLAAHRRLDAAPSGTGDLLTALFAALMAEDLAPEERLARAVGGVALAVEAAERQDAPELPLAGLGARLKDEPAAVRIERLA